MAFDFLGTFSLEQLRELRSFLESEIEDVEQQINTLFVELDNSKNVKIELSIADNNFGGKTLETMLETEFPDVERISRQDDTNSAKLISKIKKNFIQSIKYKREKLEFKIKKMIDNIEQIKEMIDRKNIAKTQTIQLLDEVERLFNSYNDNHLFQTTSDLKNYKQGI